MHWFRYHKELVLFRSTCNFQLYYNSRESCENLCEFWAQGFGFSGLLLITTNLRLGSYTATLFEHVLILYNL